MAVLAVNVERDTVRVPAPALPALSMAPPSVAVFLENVQSETLRVPPASFWMVPP